MSEKLSVALIEPVGGHGGMDLYDYGLATALAKLKVKVHYFTCEETELRSIPGVESQHIFTKVWSTKNKFLRLFHFLRAYLRAIRLAKKASCSIAHLQFFELSTLNLLVLFCFRLRRMKVVLTLHDIESFHLKPNRFIEKQSLKMVAELIVHNEICKNLLLKKLNSEREIHVIPHGNYVDFLPVLPDKGSSNETFELLFFGQIKEVKGLDLLLKAMAELVHESAPVHLTIAGKVWKTDLDFYKNLISDLGLTTQISTHFHYIPNDEVASLFQKANLVVLPYRKIYQSGVLLLSMSYGKPVLCSDLDAFKEIIIDKKNGFFFEQGNPEDLANKIRWIVQQRELLHAIKQNADLTIRKDFAWDNIARRTLNVYQRLA